MAQNSYAVLWFKGKELNMVFGLQLSFARLGSTVNFMVMEILYQWVSQFYKGFTCTGITLLIGKAMVFLTIKIFYVNFFFKLDVRQLCH